MENKREINVLILSSYNNMELVNQFIEAKKELNINGKVITSDMNKYVPTSFIADKHVYIRHLAEEGSEEDIIRICNEENISLIIPITDKQLNILCQYKKNIEENTNAKIMISDEDIIDIVKDKFKTSEFLHENNFYTPRIITDKDIIDENYAFPLYIKPFDGGGSQDNFKINSKEELDFLKYYIDRPIIQEFIDGEEYCVDIFADFDGNPITIVPKLRSKVVAGTILEGKIVKDRLIIDTMKELVNVLKPCGEINVDCMLVDDRVYIIEINARISAGAIFAYKAGANTPKNLYRLLMGDKLEYNEDYIDDLTFVKYNKFFVNNNEKVISGI